MRINDGARLHGLRQPLAGIPDTVTQARRLTSSVLDAGPDVPPSVRSDVLLVVSELVSNAVRHAGVPIQLAVAVTDIRVRIEVTDPGRAGPLVAQHPSPTSQSGRGLLIVESITDAWGVAPEDEGKTVWAEVLTDANS